MARAWLRFYAELNDFLPPTRRQCDIPVEFAPPTPVGHLIEGLGVPHTEVELVLLNGVSVGLDARPGDGERISVYPMFEALDVTPLLRIRPRPLREPRFLADAHLGKLAHLLRMLGFDTLYFNDLGDARLAEISADEGRVLLTRDRALLMHKRVTHGCYIRSREPRWWITIMPSGAVPDAGASTGRETTTGRCRHGSRPCKANWPRVGASAHTPRRENHDNHAPDHPAVAPHPPRWPGTGR